MDVVDKFNNLLNKEFEKFIDVEEMGTDEFITKFTEEPSYDITVVIEDEASNKVVADFNNSLETIEFLFEENSDDYNIIVEYSPLYHLEEITNIAYQILTNKTNFTNEEVKMLVDCIKEDFYDEKIDYLEDEEIDEEILNYYNLLTEGSSKEVLETFYEDEDFSSLLLSYYCSRLICINDYLSQTANDNEYINATSVVDLNTFLRQNLIYLLECLEQEAYSKEDSYKLISYYLTNNVSIQKLSDELFQKLYNGNILRELKLKPYLNLLIIYDFYNSAFGDSYFSDLECEELRYLDFIKRNSLKDIYTLFLNDENFSLLAIKHFEFLNSFEKEDDSDINNEIKEKFAPIYKLDLFGQKIKKV